MNQHKESRRISMPVVLPAVLPVVLPIVALAITFLLARVCVAQNPPLTPGQQMMKTYAGSDDTETFLNEPKVREELKACWATSCRTCWTI